MPRAIAIWENEGGAPGRDSMEHQYGRRIEADRSWTVYHVFTGVAARVGGDAMIGLSRSDATSGMMSLNLRNAERREQRISLLAPWRCVVRDSGKPVMTLAFPNPSRSFDEVRNAVRFIGHDGMFQVRFLVEAGALEKSGTELRGTGAVGSEMPRGFRFNAHVDLRCQRAKPILTAVVTPIL